MDTIKIFVNKVIQIFEVNNSNSVKLSIFSVLTLIFISSFLHQTSFSSLSDGTTRPQYLYDNANLINNKYRPLIDGYLRNLDRQTSAEIVIYTIPSFIGHGIKKDGVEINDRDTLANYLFNEVTLDGMKGIGKKGKDNGVLILFSSERDAVGGSMRIEVGRGLEGNITDGTAGTILDSYLVPARQDYEATRDLEVLDKAFLTTMIALGQKIGYNNEDQIYREYEPSSEADTWQVLIPFIIVICFVGLSIYLGRKRRGRGFGLGGRGRGGLGGSGFGLGGILGSGLGWSSGGGSAGGNISRGWGGGGGTSGGGGAGR